MDSVVLQSTQVQRMYHCIRALWIMSKESICSQNQTPTPTTLRRI